MPVFYRVIWLSGNINVDLYSLLFNSMPKIKIVSMSDRKKKYTIIFVLVFVPLCFICLVYSYFEARSIAVREMVFADNDLPESFEGCKLIFVSDFHVNFCFTGKDVESLVERINEREPDIVILGGDYTKKAEGYSLAFFKGISKLNSTYGVYSVLGNHDHWEDAELIQSGLVECGFNICDNKSYWVSNGKDSIKIGGVGDLWEDLQLPENTVSDVKEDDFCILISHNPDYLEMLDSDRIDLVLSGHTHGGQITFFGLWAPIMPSTMHPGYLQTGMKYRYGWKQKKDMRLYVTSGVGVGDFPLRFFARPEIVEITLTR